MISLSRKLLAPLGFVLLCAVLPAQLSAQSQREFRAGAATSNVTPWLGVSINGGMQDRTASHIHDELYARCLVLDDGRTQIAFVVVDSCMVPREIFDAAKRIVHKHARLPIDHMLMSATHTHSAPTVVPIFQSQTDDRYKEFLTQRIADSVRRAVNNLTPARIGWGAGQVSDQVFNRRWRMKPGTIPANPFNNIDRVRMNPPRGSSDLIEPSGPVDPTLSILSVQSLEGQPIALLANYSLHYVGGTERGAISADYFGLFTDRIRTLLGGELPEPPFVGIMSNGTSGNINNIDFRQPPTRRPPYEQMHRVADAVAREAYRVQRTIQHHNWVPLDMRQREVQLDVRLPTEEEANRAKRIVLDAKGPALRSRREIYARETVLLAEYPEQISLILQALRIGELAIAAIPCEVFVETGLELRDRSPFDSIFTISLANGYRGYLPTVAHHELGGYETWRARSSYLEIKAAPKIVDVLVDLLEGLRTSP